MNSRTLFVDLNRLSHNEEVATILIRLMMACNDLSLANSCLSKYKDDIDKRRDYINVGAAMYFVRLQIGHLHEGLKIINDLRNNKHFQSKLKICSSETQTLFENICNCIDGGADKDKYNKYFSPIRHNLVFHYHENGKWIKRALKEKREIKKQTSSRVTFGHMQKMRYELADEIIDSIVCRNLFEIPYSVDFEQDRSKVDEILDYGSKLAESFVFVSSELIYKFSEDYSAI